jgi:beta-lactamase superfamily II metal-dependent hydrolase
MKVDIFDVGHGACSVITSPDGKKLMIDCGSKTDAPYWWPSIQFFGQHFDALVVTNLDEDHLRDFASALKNISFDSICINNTIDAYRLKSMKKDGMGQGVQSLHSYLQQNARLNLQFTLPDQGEPIPFPVWRLHRHEQSQSDYIRRIWAVLYSVSRRP